MKAKAVVRDVGRALDMPYADVDRIAKQIPPALDMTLDKALAENPVLKDMVSNDAKVKEVIDIGRRLEGMSRHASVHAAGVVIAPGPITDYAPLYKGARDEITTQWNMKEVERIGLLKMDFLGLSTLTLIRTASKRSSVPKASTWTSMRSRSTTRRPTRSSVRVRHSGSSSLKARACASFSGKPSPSASMT